MGRARAAASRREGGPVENVSSGLHARQGAIIVHRRNRNPVRVVLPPVRPVRSARTRSVERSRLPLRAARWVRRVTSRLLHPRRACASVDGRRRDARRLVLRYARGPRPLVSRARRVRRASRRSSTGCAPDRRAFLRIHRRRRTAARPPRTAGRPSRTAARPPRAAVRPSLAAVRPSRTTCRPSCAAGHPSRSVFGLSRRGPSRNAGPALVLPGIELDATRIVSGTCVPANATALCCGLLSAAAFYLLPPSIMKEGRPGSAWTPVPTHASVVSAENNPPPIGQNTYRATAIAPANARQRVRHHVERHARALTVEGLEDERWRVRDTPVQRIDHGRNQGRSIPRGTSDFLVGRQRVRQYEAQGIPRWS